MNNNNLDLHRNDTEIRVLNDTFSSSDEIRVSQGRNAELDESGDGDSRISRGGVKIRARKGQVQVVRFSVSSSSKCEDKVVNEYVYEIGDMVWGKVKSHPWWPGHIYSPVFASPSVLRTRMEGHVLVAFFGDSSYGWFDPAQLLPFESSFSDKCKQTSSRTFVNAVEEAVSEATRRSALAFACRCRNAGNFRPGEVEGYFAVDVCDYEPGTVYSAEQIRKARDNLKPREMVAFLNQVAASPTGNEDEGIEFMKNKAAVIAYRNAVYEEVDETYAQAFGHQPDARSSHKKNLDTGHSPKVPIRAPLSGPLVIAEALGRGKGSAKLNKGKVQAKKDQYLFKRRDEANELKSSVRINLSPVTSSEQPVYIEGSSAIVEDDYVLQKRSASVSTEHMVQEKQELTEMRAENYVSNASEVPADEGMIMEDEFTAVKVGTAGIQLGSSKAESPSKSLVDQDPGQFSHPLEARSSFDKGKHVGMKIEASLVPNVEVGLTAQNSSKMIGEMPLTFESSGVNIYVKDDHPSSTASEDFDPSLSQPVKTELRDSFITAHLSETTNAELHGKDTKIQSDIGEKKLRIHRRTVGELNSESSTVSENIKKKLKKEFIGSQNMQMHPSGGKNASSVDNVAGKYVHTPVASRDSQVDPQKKKDDFSTSFSPDSVATRKTSKTENIKLELPQLLYNLKALALNPFHHLESSPTVTRQIVLRFRSLVFQKSLAPLPPANSESKVTRRSKPAAAVATNIVSAENVRELKSVKMQKLVVRPDDPAKGGRKRGPSDRQEEIAAKRKKIIDAKLLTAQRRTAEKSSLMQRGEVKETSASTMKSVKPEPVKKVEPLSRASDPTMLLMKFPLHGTLPSINELKARFIRFGQLDHSACRVFWKSLTCRVVFRHKVDAQAAYKYAAATSNMFGTTGVRCYLREMEPEQESGKVQRDEGSMSTSQLRDSAVERRFAAPLASQTMKQSGAQVKSILKRATGDETSGNGGIRGTPRVKFMLGGEEYSKGEERLMIGNKNSTNAIFADGGTSTTHAIDFNSKNFQNITLSPLPPLLPNPTTGAFQFPGPRQCNLQYTEEAPRINHNFNTPTEHPMTQSTPNIDISEQMINLLTKCNDIVNNVAAFLGYVPYHPL